MPAPESQTRGSAKAKSNRTKLRRLKRRSEFLKAAGGFRWYAPGLILQGRCRRADADDGTIRVGFTCSKKVGNAVVRNLAKRRLRHAADLVLTRSGRSGWDYVLVGLKNRTARREFRKLVGDLEVAVARVHRQAQLGSKGRGTGRQGQP